MKTKNAKPPERARQRRNVGRAKAAAPTQRTNARARATPQARPSLKAPLETNSRIANFLNNVADPFVIWDRQYRYVFVSPQAEQILGHTSTDLLGKGVWEVFPNAVEAWKPHFDQALASGQANHFEHRSAVTERWYEVHVFPGPDGLLIYLHDCTERKQNEQALQHRQRELTMLNAIGNAINEASECRAGLQAALEHIARFAEVDGVECRLYNPSQHLQHSAHWGLDLNFIRAAPKVVRADSLPASAMSLRAPIYVPDLASEPRFSRRELAEALGYRSSLSVPMIALGRSTGVFTLYSRTAREFSDKQQSVLLMIGEQLGVAIERTRLSELEAQHAQQLAQTNALMLGLSRIAPRIETRLGVAHVMALVAQQLLRLRLHCVLLLLEPDGETLVCRNVSLQEKTLQLIEKVAGIQLRNSRFRIGQFPVLYNLIARRMPLLIEDVTTRARLYLPQLSAETIKRLLVLAGLHARMPLCVLPLTAKNQLLGVLVLWGTGLTRNDLAALSIFSTQLATALDNARLFEQLEVSRTRLQRLHQQLVNTQEDERRRLSRELHDEAGQVLTALKINLKLLATELAPVNGRYQRLDEAVELTDMTMEMIRQLAHNLRPPALDTLGLHATLENYCREFARHTQLTIDYQGVDLPNLPSALSITIYRMVQEAITNVAKHAQASRVSVSLSYQADIIHVAVADNGVGIRPEALAAAESAGAGIGLAGMQERVALAGGSFEIESDAGRGTRLLARLPWRGRE